MATTVGQSFDPDVVRKFHFTREMIEGPVYRKYEKAIRKFWSVEDLDFTQDVEDWNRIDDEQKRGLLGVTVRFLAGEQNVTDELVPMLAASHALDRFDWIVYLSTFLMEEAKHAEFFMRWHDRVVGVLEPEEVAQHFLVRGKTIDPSGRFEVRDVLHEALPYYGRRLMEATMGGTEAEIERAFVAFSAAYNAFVEGVLTMPSYEIVIDTTTGWNAFPDAQAGLQADPHGRGAPHHVRHLRVQGPDREGPDVRGGGPQGLRRVPRQHRRPRRVPEGRPRARSAEVPDDEGAALPKPLPGDGDHPRRDADRADPRPVDRLRRGRGGRLGVAKRWTCVEAGCDYELVAPDVRSAIEGAQKHIAEAHSSFELEEMIEDVLQDVTDTGVPNCGRGGSRLLRQKP